MAIVSGKHEPMLSQFFFTHMSVQKQAAHLRKKGVLLGTRIKEGRTVYIYMLTKIFVEVIFKNDNAEDVAERIHTLTGLKSLNDYLEKEFRTSF